MVLAEAPPVGIFVSTTVLEPDTPRMLTPALMLFVMILACSAALMLTLPLPL